MSQKPEEITIAMLGSSGVGKTTILASMYEQLTISKIANLEIIPDEESAAKLEKKLAGLKSMLAPGQEVDMKVQIERGIEGNEENIRRLERRLAELRNMIAREEGSMIASEGSGNTVQIGKGIPGTEAPNDDPYSIMSLAFDIPLPDQQSLQLHFYDYPGRYISGKARDIEKQFVTELVTAADVVIIAIDTPALVMSKGRYNEVVNKTKLITEIFKETYINIESPKLVLFVPVKCEMEMEKGETEALELTEKIKTAYSTLLEFFASPFISSEIAVVVTPIQTLGCVKCTQIAKPTTEDNPIFLFRKHPSADAKYSPQDTDQPLSYIMAFLLNHHLRNQDNQNIFRRGVAWVFRWDKQIKESIRIFAKRCKKGGGFEVIQGKELLDINIRK